tara:strand:- start:1096 stop:2313 length:1218 start_codon:yes stop_codon:yes gene_type:complete
MTSFKNILLSDLGITVQFITGYLDMPARQGETFYDWGDEIEPLISEEDIYFGTRRIIIEAFYRGSDWYSSAKVLEQITTEETLSTEYGDFQVKLNQVKILKDYKGVKTLSIEFLELNPNLSGALANVAQLDGVRLDGHDLFSEFGLLVENVNGFDAPELKAAQQTTDKINALSEFRQPPEINVKVNGIYASKAEMSAKITELNKLFAKEGLRHFVYGGYGYQCYCTEGYKITINKNWVSINLKLKVMSWYNIEAIVQEVIDRVEIGIRPQSDLSETDNSKPEFVFGKETFIAADSSKLGGELPEFYENKVDATLKINDVGEIGQNISDFNLDLTWNTGDSTIIDLLPDTTWVRGVFIIGGENKGGKLIPVTDWLISENLSQIEILKTIEDGSYISIEGQRYVNTI